MKNIFTKLLCTFAFILLSAISVFAADINITSVTYDNSGAILSINTPDLDKYELSEQPRLVIIPEEQKAYFDINSAILKCPTQDFILTPNSVGEVTIKQQSTNPNVVRITLSYDEGFNLANIQLRKLNNTLFIKFNNPKMQNYYFQQVYSEPSSSIAENYENITIQTPVLAEQESVLGQINSAFNFGGNSISPNYVMTKKELKLRSKYYIDNITPRNGAVHITGIGSLTVTKPIYLSNPERIAYDIPNTVVNPTIRNREVIFGQQESIKVGQFDKNTARVVITSLNAKKYIPVIFGDTQRLVFIDKVSGDYNSLFATKATLKSAVDEIIDLKTHTMKLVFNKPVIYSFDRLPHGLEVNLYNVDKISGVDLKSAFIFEDIQLSKTKGGWYKLILPDIETIDIHTGVDAKTLRFKIKHTNVQMPEKNDDVIIAPIDPIVPVRKTNKIYIVIDPGHGGSDCGATRNGIYEKDITLDISKRVENMLKKKGYEVYMTRSTDATVSLQERVDISEEIAPDIFVSIHVNSSNSDSPNGLETHYYKDNSLMLAKTVHASMLNNIKAHNRGLFKSKFYVINHTTAPAILVEIGFISNPAERAQIVSESRKQATAKAIAEGIDDYFR